MNHSNLDWARLVQEHKLSQPGSLAGARNVSDVSRLDAFLRADSLRLPSASSAGLGERIDLTSFLHNNSNNGSSNSNNEARTAVSSIAEYAALQQQLFLEEQARRDILSQALMQSQSSTGGGAAMSDLLAKLGVYQQGMLSQQSGKGTGEKTVRGSTPPLKKRRIIKTQGLSETTKTAEAAPVMSLSYKERKSTFPLPPKEGQEGRAVRILSLTKFENAWKHLETKTSLTDPSLKRKFVAEFFGRKMIKKDEERLYKKVHGLSSGAK